MRQLNVILAMGILVAGAGLLKAADGKEIQEAMKKIEGTWRAVSYEKDGVKPPEERFREFVKNRRSVDTVEGLEDIAGRRHAYPPPPQD